MFLNAKQKEGIMENVSGTIFKTEELRPIIWLQLSLTFGVLGEFFFIPPVSYVATAILFGFPIVLWCTSASKTAVNFLSGKHLIFLGINYVLYPIGAFFIISYIAVGSIKTGAQLLEMTPGNELSFVQLLFMMVVAIPSERELARLGSYIILFSLLMIYVRIVIYPLLNIYRAQSQKGLLYPIGL